MLDIMGGDSGQRFEILSPSGEYPADRRAREWAKRLETAGIEPRQLIGELIAGGAPVDQSFISERGEELWSPRVITKQEEQRTKGRRIMILPYGNIEFGRGPQYGAEVLKAGLPFAFKISDEANAFFMVPYLRFTDKGEIDKASSSILLLREAQVNDLLELVRGTQSSVANQTPPKI